MTHFKGQIFSKLPHAGTSIFAVMSKMAADHQAVNLFQGFPDFPVSTQLIDLVHHYMKMGFNQYAPMPGVDRLRQAIALKMKSAYGVDYSPELEITITAGATQALYTAISAFVKESDEVIIFEPAYDSYAPAVKANGGLVKYVKLLSPDFEIDWAAVKMMVSNRTKMIIINSPHNPTGSLLKESDLQQLEALTRNSDIIVISDEVYEHIVFDGYSHHSVCRLPGLVERSLVVGSFGKTFHATGWKTGFIVGPEELIAEFRKHHQFVVFASNTPVQYALADFLEKSENYSSLSEFYQQKRDFFVEGLTASRFHPIPCHGTYFQLLDYSAISDETEMIFAERLVKEHGIAVIPVSAFYHNQENQHLIRVCFAKTEETLSKAIELLCKV
ncbi:MAG: methionine aminotransferase [Bacteroidales bacterium]|jgi:methionine aminotransferase|nr:methionine aminotransferase [Bacteroidales bacterium]MDD3702226.1 methionine aminotransferase [Bacteroidales bacterium]MDY0368899.1 methionine aminotransferase [Bacteroidales bacterium]